MKPDIKVSIPANEDDAVRRALGEAPEVLAAWHDEGAQIANIDVVRGSLLPELALQGSSNTTRNENVPEQFVHDNGSVSERATAIPG